jgi:hypothetical protein
LVPVASALGVSLGTFRPDLSRHVYTGGSDTGEETASGECVAAAQQDVFFIPLGISALCSGFRDAVAPTFEWLLLLFDE